MTTAPWLLRFPDLRIPEDRVLFVLAPEVVARQIDIDSEIRASLRQPIGSPPLAELVSRGDRVLVLADDATRPTPRSRIIPPVLDALNAAGIPEDDITILIALGTHRPMTEREIAEAFGLGVTGRVSVLNHDFRNLKELVSVGRTEQGTPIIVNRRVREADFVLGVGSIVPHPEAGWSGGAKIFQPGVCGEETTAWTHMLAARQPDHLALAGAEENPVRREIERVAVQGGLRFIVNVVFDGAGKVVKVVAGDPIKAHRVGVRSARRIFVRAVPERADIVLVDARPADLDYWQGIKPLAFATRAVKPGGTVVLVGDFREGISPIYEAEFHAFGTESRDGLRRAEAAQRLERGVCTEALYLHAAILERADVICVSDGISRGDRNALGFRSAASIPEALGMAFERVGGEPTIGVILQGGDVLPCIDQEKGKRPR
jgi:nickel-dependent lactate racemase